MVTITRQLEKTTPASGGCVRRRLWSVRLRPIGLPSAYRRAACRRGAFTLTEVMLAVAILGVGLIMVAAIFPVAADQQRQAVDQSTARIVAETAFRTLETKLRPNYFTHPSAAAPSPPQFYPSDNPGFSWADPDPTSNRTTSNGDEVPLLNPEFDPWPVGVWAHQYEGYQNGTSNVEFARVDPPDDATHYWVYLPSRKQFGQLRATNPPVDQGIGREFRDPFALSDRVTLNDRLFPPGVSLDDARWSWDYALRMDRSGAMQAIVFVHARVAADARYLYPRGTIANQRIDGFGTRELTLFGGNRIPHLATHLDMGTIFGGNTRTRRLQWSFGASDRDVLLNRQMVANYPVWLVGRETGRVVLVTGWEGNDASGTPLLAGGFLAGRNTTSNPGDVFQVDEPLIMTRVRTNYSSDEFENTGEIFGERDPTIAVFSSVIRPR